MAEVEGTEVVAGEEEAISLRTEFKEEAGIKVVVEDIITNLDILTVAAADIITLIPMEEVTITNVNMEAGITVMDAEEEVIGINLVLYSKTPFLKDKVCSFYALIILSFH